MTRLARTAWMIACLISPAAAQATAVSVTGDDPRQSITVTIEGAPIEAVLKDLHERYGFEISGLQNVQQGEALSATLSGSLQSILERLLRNWNHMIVRSPDNPSGIAKVTIINAAYGATPQRGVGTSGDADRRRRQALSDLD